MNELKTNDSLPRVERILRRYPDLELAIVFGSIAAGNASVESDLDLAIKGAKILDLKTRLQLIDELAECLGRPVDLIDLNTVGEPLLGQIIKRGRRIFGSDSCFAELLIKHLYNKADFIPYQSRILNERRARWIGS